MNKPYFSTVWEDYTALKSALRPSQRDTILTICSGGDNVLNFLSDKVERIVAVDYNPAQLSLAKLKLTVISQFDFGQVLNFLEGIGDTVQNEQTLRPMILEKSSQKLLSSCDFSRGINNVGDFDTKILPFASLLVRTFFSPIDFENSGHKKKMPGIVSSLVYEIVLFLLSRKWIYKLLLPDFPYNHINVNAKKSLRRAFNNFLKYNDFSKNPYLQKAYYKKYKIMPPYLQSIKFEFVKNNADRIEFRQGDILSHLKKFKQGEINKMNFSDIFDWCSEEQWVAILNESYRVLSKGGIIFYREFLVSRDLAKGLTGKFKYLKERANKIHKKDNTPYYHRIMILKKR